MMEQEQELAGAEDYGAQNGAGATGALLQPYYNILLRSLLCEKLFNSNTEVTSTTGEGEFETDRY